MKAATQVLTCILCLFPVITPADQPEEPAAADVLAAVISRLPPEPLRITGDLLVRRRHGMVERELRFELNASWGADPQVTRYTIRDAFGTDLEELTVRRSATGAPSLTYAAGSPLQPASTPSLSDPIQQSDISWSDLTLSFLWWSSPAFAGRDEARGRPCHVIEVVPPAGGAGRCAKARLWIDREALMIVKAETYDAGGTLLRSLWVDSFKKVNDRWMIKDMEVQSFPVEHRTKLTVREVAVQPAVAP